MEQAELSLGDPPTTVVNIKSGADFDVYIGRPSVWGNPFVIGVHGTRDHVVQYFREHIARDPEFMASIRRELAGKVLGCYCKPAACHGDVLAEIANDTRN